MVRVGGWGPHFGDEGSGFWIGREAIRAALRLHDAGDSPEFVSEVARALKLHEITEAPAAWKEAKLDVHSVAALAALVASKAETERAKRILTEAASHLRQIAELARQRANLPESCQRSIAGSVGSNPLMQRLIGLAFTPPMNPPERGAILWARDRIPA
jgi:N-acetylglucosamine kinase